MTSSFLAWKIETVELPLKEMIKISGEQVLWEEE